MNGSTRRQDAVERLARKGDRAFKHGGAPGDAFQDEDVDVSKSDRVQDGGQVGGQEVWLGGGAGRRRAAEPAAGGDDDVDRAVMERDRKSVV